MLKSYFKIAWRNLMKNKIFSFINIFGLTIGLTSFLLIALYVFDELTYDSFHKHAGNTYRVIDRKTTAEGKQTKIPAAGYQVSEKSKSDFPEIKEIVRLFALGRTNISTVENTNVFYEELRTSSPGFFRIFDFELLYGDRATALRDPHSVILTAEMAQKLFHTTDVLGKLIKSDRDITPFKITAVLKNLPSNSHLSFKLLFSESSINNAAFRNFVSTDWNSDGFTTYILLNDKTNAHNVETKINRLAVQNQDAAVKYQSHFLLQPLKDIHFYSADIENNPGKTGNLTYIYTFSIIALFVLLIACINYMNLTTALFTKRTKEIAVRKVTGASRKNLTAQFLTETFLITAIALLLALGLTRFLLSFWFNSFTEKQLTLGIGTDYRIWFGIMLIVIIAGLLSGVYPALFQARLQPLLLLKSKINIGKGNLSIRRSLVVFQFVLSIIMIVVITIVYRQMQYINTKDMGFRKDHLLVVDINSGKVRGAAETIKSEFGKLAHVKDVSVSSRVPGEWKDLPKVKVKNENIQAADGNDMYFLGVDAHFLKTYQITLNKGRNFAAGSLGDSAAVLINETAARELGIKSPSEQLIKIPLDKPFNARVIGIVKDFNFQSLHQSVAPIVLGFQNNPVQSIDYFTVRVASDNIGQTIEEMNTVLHKVDQNHLFEYHFLDKQWDLFYHEDHIRQTIFLIVAILTVLIACLGLFGLATYAAEQRRKEIGIRKVLGATVTGIVALFSTDFLKLVVIAMVIASPIAWWAMHNWLQSFAYRIAIQWWMFALAGTIAVLIAMFTISLQAFRAALMNPVKSLRMD
ncbi:putative ABC transport system permease protein [Mucilaginibacter lappiensis]